MNSILNENDRKDEELREGAVREREKEALF